MILWAKRRAGVKRADMAVFRRGVAVILGDFPGRSKACASTVILRALLRLRPRSMQRLLEFAQNHPYLIAAAILIILLVLGDELLRRMRKFREVPPAEGVLLINRGAAVVDIRPSKDFGAGHVIGARNIPVAELDGRITELDKFKEQPLIVCCDAGQASPKAASILIKHGFKAVHTIKGGIKAWQNEHFPLERG